MNTTKSQFEKETGWTEADACAMAKECAREQRLFGSRRNRRGNRRTSCNNSKPSTFSAAEFERQTGWTWGDAVGMSADLQRERRVFGHPSKRRNRRRSRPSMINAVAFKRQTGWSIEDAAREAKQTARERRLFGSAVYMGN